MNQQTIELSDSQLDSISGGNCSRPEPPKCEPRPCYEPKKEKKRCDFDDEPPKHCGGWDWKEFYEDFRKHY